MERITIYAESGTASSHPLYVIILRFSVRSRGVMTAAGPERATSLKPD
jgi:hypothetical protein